MFRKALWQGLTYIFALLLAVSILASQVLEVGRSQVDAVLGTTSEILVSESTGKLYNTFLPDEDVLIRDDEGNITGADSNALIKRAVDLGRREAAEGSVLLKNNGALPLATGSKVTIMGARSVTPALNSRQGQASKGAYITFTQALSDTQTHFDTTSVDSNRLPAESNIQFDDLKYGLKENGATAGARFQLNETVINAYNGVSSKPSLQESPTNDPKEPTLAQVGLNEGGANLASLAQYNDAAILVFGRPSSESSDYKKNGLAASLQTATITEPLQLTQNELDLVTFATNNFEKVIVLVNTNSPMEIGELKNNDKVDAVLWIGHPGNYGFLGVADVLCGKASPSGGLYDIYPTKNLSSPATVNMGEYSYSNYGTNYLQTRSSKAHYYVIENENIYTGYRYYETRYYDSIVNPDSNAASDAGVYASDGNWNYDAEVAYGFGYGLTYTNLKYELVGNPTFTYKAHEIYADVKVKVTNNGEVATRANVQVYGQSPFTDYDKQHNVEKAAIQLLEFAKTPLIQPGSSEEVTVTIDLQNLASYDSSFVNPDGSKGCYIFDRVDGYYFSVGNGAHEALNNILVKEGKTTGMVGTGDANLAYKWQYTMGTGTVDSITFGKTKNNTQVYNKIEYADWNFFDPGKITYLTRKNWKDSYPIEYKGENALAVPDSMKAYLMGDIYRMKTDDDTSEIVWGSTETEYKFYELVNCEWNDPRLDAIIDQLTLNEAVVLSAAGGDALPSIASIGLLETQGTENAGNGLVYYLSGNKDPQAPWDLHNDANRNWNGEVFGSAPLLASTFDPDIMHEMGRFVGMESLFLGVPILWGPGLNTHRNAYNGRSGEYYSEDPVLSGNAAMEFAIGAADYGLIASPKHYAFNDQETQRNGVAPYMLEQRAREIELRAFQIAMEAPKYDRLRGKDVGMMGYMTSFSKIGPVEVTASWGMNNGLMVEEWGFHGYAVTDINDDKDLWVSYVHAGMTGYDLRRLTNINITTLSNNLGNQIVYFEDGTYITNKRVADLASEDENGDIALMKDLTLMKDLKASVRRTIWILARTNLMNRFDSSTHIVSQNTWWRTAYKASIGVTAGLTAISAGLYVVSTFIGKKEGV